MVAKPSRRYTFGEYLAIESASPEKHEFFDGFIVSMAGRTPDHAGMSANVITALGMQLRGKPCGIHDSSLRIGVQRTGNVSYPDVTVFCQRPELDPRDTSRCTVTNPTVIVEVLSPGTEERDRTEKLEDYKTITSLQEVVLVEHEARRIEVVRRVGATWKHFEYLEGAAEIASLNCKLP